MSYVAEFLLYALKIGALELVPDGRKLKSGRISPYFFNSGLFCSGESISRLACAYASTIMGNFKVDVIFGPAYKGIPLAVAVAQVNGGNTGYAFNRKEEKDHGEGGSIVGASLVGKQVLIVDDVMTTGTFSGEAVEIVQGAGGIPVGCVIAFDRQERSSDVSLSAVQEFEKNYRIPVRAVATLADLIDLMQSNPRDPRFSILPKILEYRRQYGV